MPALRFVRDSNSNMVQNSHLQDCDGVLSSQSRTERDVASPHGLSSGWFKRAESRHIPRADKPLSEATFLEMQQSLMRHIVALEVLIALLMFAIVITGGIIGIRSWRRGPRSSRSSQPGAYHRHRRHSSDTYVPGQMHTHSLSSTMVSPFFTSGAQNAGSASFTKPGYLINSAKTLPKTPPSGGSIDDRQPPYVIERIPPAAVSVVSVSSVSSARDPFASPRRDSSTPLPPVQPPQPAPLRTSPPAFPSSQLTLESPTHEPSPLKRATDTASLLGDELAPLPREAPSSSSAYSKPHGVAPPGKKSAGQMSLPRSVWGDSSGIGGDDGPSTSAANSNSGYPTVASYLARLQSTSRRELAQYASIFAAYGWTTLDTLQGVTGSDLKSAVPSMSSTDAEFIARSVRQELDWISADRVRGGIGFRMVLSS